MEKKTHKPTDVPGQIKLAPPRAGCFWLAALFIFSLACCARAEPARFVPGRILIKPKAGVAETKFTGKLNQRGAVERATLPHSSVRVVSVPEDQVDAALAGWRNDPDVEFAERDFIAAAAFAPNDPFANNEWHLEKIQAPQAWDQTAGHSNVIVAVLDSGANPAHPDLAARLLAGYDFVNDSSTVTDDFGHGTAVAGTIAAMGNNATGVAGVAFGCRVLPVKVMDSFGFAAYSAIAQGIRYAVDHGARVINLSIAGSAASATLQDAIDYAWTNNVLVVAAAGNNANSTLQYPAACDHVVAVSATEPDDSLAPFSSFGYITLAAPGDNIWTTQRDVNNPYGPWRGTSFASPVVAAVAALVASANPTLSVGEIVSLLEQNADDIGVAGFDPSFGYGRVNALKAVTAASAAPGGLPADPPVAPGTNTPPADTIAPSLAIAQSPANGARLASPEIFLAGSAADDVAVARIEIEVNGAIQIAAGTTAWSASVNLAAGANLIHVRSVDTAGNASAFATLSLTRVANAPLSVRVNGLGTVTPDLNASLLEIGKTYTVKAVPAAGQVFAGWSGAGGTATLTFVMQSNLVLTANFAASPFPAVRGTYAGLAANTNGVTPDSSGYFTLTVTPSGAFTGRLLLGGARYGFRGQFNLAGDALIQIERKLLAPLQLALHVDLAGAEQVTGWLTDGAWTAGVLADRDVFNPKFNPARQAGLRNFILQRADDTAVAAKGAGKISANGSANVRGQLTDGRAFATASALGRNGDCPFYLSLSKGTEVVIGWLNFPTTPDPTASGTVLWVSTGTNAFATRLQAASAP